MKKEFTDKELNEKVSELYHLYKDNDIVLLKLNNYINIQLPKLLINENDKLKERNERMILLNKNKNDFILKFLSKNHYLYINSTELFILYDNFSYNIINEDDIQYNILSSISNLGGNITQWKFKIKNEILSKIKNNNISNTIPESNTIQNTIQILFPFILKSKDEVKYFLTYIGDIILKKDNIPFIFINIKFKNIINELCKQIYFYTLTSIDSYFKYKFSEQYSNKLRILNCNKDLCTNNEQLTSNTLNNLKNNILNIIFVSCYYSNRFQNSDLFLIDKCESNINYNILFLKNNNTDEIIELFLNKFVIKTDNSLNSISYKNMLFLWNSFLEQQDLPKIICDKTLKTKLINKLNFKDDLFQSVLSNYLKNIDSFLSFFNDNFYENKNEINFELEEIYHLYKNWLNKQKKSKSKDMNYYEINETKIFNIINYYFNNCMFENEKYLINFSTNLWNKKDEIKSFLSNNDISMLTINEVYQEYTNYQKNNQNNIVSKNYFDKYIETNNIDLN